MSWVTVLWSMSAAACLTLAAVHLFVWLKDRTARQNLLFSVMASLVAVFGAFEFLLMRSTTIAEYAWLHRWGHVPAELLLIAMLAFVRCYFGTGRAWLFRLAIGWRLLVLALNFLSPTSLNFTEITTLRPFSFLGETVVVPAGIPTPWARLGESGILLALIYFADATLSLYRRDNPRERQRALFVGGSVLGCISAALVIATLNHTGLFPVPYCASLFFMLMVLAMAYELGQDMLHAAELARDLRETEHRMTLASEAANLGIWIRDVVRNEVWASDKWRELFGFKKSDRIELDGVLQRLHPEDRETVRQTLTNALEPDGQYETEYRVVLPDRPLRWISSRGRVEYDGNRKPLRVRGVSLDITHRKQAELEVQLQRQELAHLARVTMLGELSGSLAHELNQPLAIILTNAQVLQRVLAQSPPDLSEASEILRVIVSEDRRASEVIRRLRSLLKHEESTQRPVSLGEIVEDVLRIMRTDLNGRGVTVECTLAPNAPLVLGDRIQLQQVLLNLILNACDAMSAKSPAARHLTISMTHHDGAVRVSVSDTGCGLPPEAERMFEPFYTTKKQGLGLGLPICRSIITAHHGRLWAEAGGTVGEGTTFVIELPAVAEG